MSSCPMIISAVTFHHPVEMIFIDQDHMVEALSPDTSNHPLHKRILPGTLGRRDHFFDPHPFYPLAKLFPVNLVAVPEQKPRDAIFGESFNVAWALVATRFARKLRGRDVAIPLLIHYRTFLLLRRKNMKAQQSKANLRRLQIKTELG